MGDVMNDGKAGTPTKGPFPEGSGRGRRHG